MKTFKFLLIVTALSLLLVGTVAMAQNTTVLKVAYWRQSGTGFAKAVDKWFGAVIPEFKALYPNVKIKLIPITGSEGDYYTKLDLMMRSASTAPDVVYEDSFMIGSDAAAGYLLPLNKYVTKWVGWKHFYPAMQKITEFHGKIYGVMNGSDVRGLWYNKNILEKAGIKVPWQPKTWADILKAAKLIKEKVPGVIPFSMYSGVPDDEASTMQGYEMLLYGTAMGNNALYNWKTNKWIVSSPGIEHTLQFIQKVFTKGLAEPLQYALNPQYGSVVSLQLLPQGKLAIDLDGMWVYGNWLPSSPKPWSEWEKVMGFALMPTEYGQAPGFVSLSGGWALSIASHSKHPNLAWNFIKIASSAKNLATYDYYVANTAVRDDEINYIYAKAPLAKVFASVMKYTHYRPAFPAYPKISYQIDLAMENAMLGRPIKATMAGYADAVKGIVGAENTETIK